MVCCGRLGQRAAAVVLAQAAPNRPLAVTDAVVGGEPAVGTGFVLLDDQHRPVERVIDQP